MEEREDLKSILAFLPVVARSWSLFWPSQVVETLKDLARGPQHSGVNSGEVLFAAISDLRRSLSLSSSHPLTPCAADGYALFFDEIMPREESGKWFGEVVPALANLLLRLPSLLQVHYQNADGLINGLNTALRLLDSQQPGLVFLSQELISALLGCSLFCLFPVIDRSAKHLPTINFDHLFDALYDSHNQKQESKIWCIIHYFEKITSRMPTGFVSFERKVLPLEQTPLRISYPKAEFWSNSVIPLCRFEVHRSGLIEDQSSGALEVDFANKYIGGGALHRGCVQWCRYASSFRFSGDYVDERDADSFGRRKTRIIAIDALCSPGMKQYKQELILRETNKAFCGFLHQSKYQEYSRLVRENERLNRDSAMIQSLDYVDDIGIATGNWGCGAFGGDPEVKAIVQWLAASQARRPFISYYTFGMKALENLDRVSRWIQLHQWTVGDLWDLLVDYSLQRLKGETNDGFFTWLLPSLLASDTEMLDLPDD
ncbi:poly(ADP-ribose) glycohydrolase 1-like isoform X2 [Rosa rugosa]|uniref:poly(ADP-ribose) glycohydrolase 1-like isoform X2 n=1 Tax=Rosa rugosa TaxID=74645 RepID=UPI002B4176C5|nr:poly(ADP-ribose) glycohydrolase 1-like isoform X2 [Rosa rugosa]